MRQLISPNEFIERWRGVSLTERSACQSHFIDLCALLNHQTPVELDPNGSFFTFEKGAVKSTGGDGWADVWYKSHFAWEYKGQHANLDRAYQQLLTYRDSLENPPLLIVCDMDRIIIRTNFTDTPTKIYEIGLEDLKDPDRFAVIREAFYNPDALKPGITTARVTEDAASHFSELAEKLRSRGFAPEEVARFLIRLLFTLFAEDVGILPQNILFDLATSARLRPQAFASALKELFGKMATGGWFGREEIRHIDGRLFENDDVIQLEPDEIRILQEVSRLDWASLSPAILGTLFERSLNPGKRSQLGAHYTSEADIMLIVEPVLMSPLKKRWDAIRIEAEALFSQWENSSSPRRRKNLQDSLRNLLIGFSTEIASTQVLDPACGSGNFLYVALRELLNLEKDVTHYAGQVGIGSFFPSVTPAQLHGIELDEYAHQLAQATIQIGYLQWLVGNGFGFPKEPILSPLDNIRQMDAVMQYGEDNRAFEPEWPTADVIIGNPPFLGDKRMRTELGDKYVTDLRDLYKGRVLGGADLVTFWFEKARSMIDDGKANRAGLLSTNSIRTGSNRKVLDRIKETGNIFMAWDDRPWILDGAAVRVSIIGFDNGSDPVKFLNGEQTSQINSDLTSHVDLTHVGQLPENAGICFLGVMKGGPFEISGVLAREMLAKPINPNGRLNSDVVKRRLGGQDVTDRPRDGWIIDFMNMPQSEACLYEFPFEYVKTVVKPVRDINRDKGMREKWWLHGRSRPDLRAAIVGLNRCLVTSEVAKWRVFIWMDARTVPDHTLHVFARGDDYFFGVLQSRVHEVWSLAMGSWIGAGNDPRYSSSRTFETFPMPWTPGKEARDDERYKTISEAARILNNQREMWLNPPGVNEVVLKERTMTALYNARTTWLSDLHKRLDKAILEAYGWSVDISDDEILEHLLKLNQQRSTV